MRVQSECLLLSLQNDEKSVLEVDMVKLCSLSQATGGGAGDESCKRLPSIVTNDMCARQSSAFIVELLVESGRIGSNLAGSQPPPRVGPAWDLTDIWRWDA